ncbi:MAG: M48 family metalloprotease [Thermodesulfobacteriota bacterium]|nr:M48 family metalloprotease [Thermodesulfobacteriota bacterium]
MKFVTKLLLLSLFFLFVTGFFMPKAALSITAAEEEELSREFMRVVLKNLELVEDPAIVNYVNKVGAKIVSILSPQPFTYRFYVIKDDVFNAFATPAGHIFIYSGLMAAMENEEELAGILGHEIAHVLCRHISQKIDRSKKISIATLAGIAAGIFLGAEGAGEVGSAVIVGSMAAGQSMALAYSREDERQADQIGLNHLTKAGYSGYGLLTMLAKIRSKQWFGTEQIPPYLTTHPAPEERLAYIDTWLEKNGKKQFSKTDSAEFKKINTRLVALYSDEALALRKYKNAVSKNPQNSMANYGYGLVLARMGNRKDAAAYIKKALEKEAFNPTFLVALGRIYFLDGQYQKALTMLESAVSIAPDDPEGLFYIGRSQMELGRFKDAESTLRMLTKKHPGYKPGFYFLGNTYGKQHKLADAHYTLGIYYTKKRENKNAVIQFEKALEKTTDPHRRQEIKNLLKKVSKRYAQERKKEAKAN